MKLSNEFTVAAPLQQAWETLLDIERVAGFLPGAKIESKEADDVFNGSMRVKVGPMVVNYKGTATLVVSDERTHVADVVVEAKETRGQGTASAVIRNRLVPENGLTRVVAETDLNITGRPAQFGRSIMQDVAGRMLDDFAKRLESYLAGTDRDLAGPEEGGGDRAAAAAPSAAPSEECGQIEEESLDLGSFLYRTPALRRAVLAVLAVGLVFVVVWRLARR